MSLTKFRRVQQWAVFSRQWWLFDAKWQDPFDSAKKIHRYLKGAHKPIFDPEQDCGDHVVVINCRHISMPDDEWRWRYYFHHTMRCRGAWWSPAWELHQKDPTLVMFKAVYKWCKYKEVSHLKHRDVIPKRHTLIARLHLFSDEEVPEDIMKNVCSQIRQVQPIPKKVADYTPKEIEEFPKLIDYPDDYAVK